MHGGRRPGAGRKKGVSNKVTAALRANLMAEGILPLEFLLGLVRDPTRPLAVRIEAAKAAAPFLHPKLQAIEHSSKGGDATPQCIEVRFVSPPERPSSPAIPEVGFVEPGPREPSSTPAGVLRRETWWLPGKV